MATTPQTKMTVEEFLALPEDDGVYRELIDGELVEYPRVPMTTRNAKHTLAVARLSQHLWGWLDSQPSLEGVVATGEVRCRLDTEEENAIGIDVAVFLSKTAADVAEHGGIYEENPVVAVEVLSPSDSHQKISDRIHLYLEAQVPQTWIVDPEFKSVTVYRPSNPPVLSNRDHVLSGEPELPGFNITVSELFRIKKPN